MINTNHYIFEEQYYSELHDETVMYFLKDDRTECIVFTFCGKEPEYSKCYFQKEHLTKNVDDCLEATDIVNIDISKSTFNKFIALARKAK